MPHVPLQTYGVTDAPCVHCCDPFFATPISDAIDKEDCAYCTHTNAHGTGVLICMTCKECLCFSHVEKHRSLFNDHHIYVKHYRLPDLVKEGEKISSSGGGEDEEKPFVAPAGDVNSIGIVDPPAYDNRCVCVECQMFFTEPSNPSVVGPHVSQGFTAIVHATPKAAVAAPSSADDNAADDPFRNCIVCKHTREYAQDPSPFSADPNGPNPMPKDSATLKCSQCECTKNNWICMTCGAVGCPRKEGGGNEHAIAHYNATGHPIVLKLGTVTSKGASMYCYSCDEEVKDPSLSKHLLHFGIDMMTAVKTSKSLGEMMYDLTIAADFSSICEIGEDGKSLVAPVLGRAGGFMGLHNFGNTCYMNSVVQLLMRSDPFKKALLSTSSASSGEELTDEARLARARDAHTTTCQSRSPRQCFDCQWLKVTTALYSAHYANTLSGHKASGNNGPADALVSPDYEEEETQKAAMYTDFVENVLPADPTAKMDKSLLPRKALHTLNVLNGATPRDFKTLNARGNKEFLSGQQQDALEYLAHVFDGIEKQMAEKTSSIVKEGPTTDPLAPFALEAVSKQQCINCQRVKYTRTREFVLRLPTPMSSEDYAAAVAKISAAAAAEKEKEGQDAKPVAPERPRVDLSSLLETYVSPRMSECRCESCKASDGGYFCTYNIYNYPEHLILSIPREYIDTATYTTKKMDVYVNVPEVIDLSMLRGPGVLQPGEEPLESHKDNAVERGGLKFVDGGNTNPSSTPSNHGTSSSAVEVDELALVQLISMGIEQPTAEWALRACKNNVETAIDFVFSHPEGPPSEVAAPAASAPSSSSSASHQTKLSDLTDGASCNGLYDVVGMVSHTGASAVTGHYVCHLKREDGSWYLYNDEKVGKSIKPPLDLGAFYLLKRRT